ncbi:cytochrome P450 4V2-like [Tropilaelaps mercedesae]|uniref:Cytochrome P450 4V2-like n=1 Tax=Tropilaelaps mercedesae TaxID=418985 RepID=A0A1V9XIJ4_9ACAR|nr:cytochrome P450 4V2-like [Tropilaelaps mercedesae]
MGVKVGAQTGSKSAYVHNVYAVGRFFLERLVRPWLYPDFVYLLTQEGRTFRDHVKGIHAFTKGVIKERKATKLLEQSVGGVDVKKRLAFLDLLLDEHLKNPQLLLEEDIREEVDTFMFEGHDTTAMALSWTIFLLGHHPEAQRKCHEELDRIFNKGGQDDGDSDEDTRPATVEDLRDMKYLECCIKEALRLYPSVPIVGREVHTTFDVSQRFALMEEKVVLSRLLRKFSIRSLCGIDRLELSAEMVLRSRNGLPVTITRRPKGNGWSNKTTIDVLS